MLGNIGETTGTFPGIGMKADGGGRGDRTVEAQSGGLLAWLQASSVPLLMELAGGCCCCGPGPMSSEIWFGNSFDSQKCFIKSISIRVRH